MQDFGQSNQGLMPEDTMCEHWQSGKAAALSTICCDAIYMMHCLCCIQEVLLRGRPGVMPHNLALQLW